MAIYSPADFIVISYIQTRYSGNDLIVKTIIQNVSLTFWTNIFERKMTLFTGYVFQDNLLICAQLKVIFHCNFDTFQSLNSNDLVYVDHILQRILYTSVAFNSNCLNYLNIIVFNFQKQQRPTKYPVWNDNVPITMWAELIDRKIRYRASHQHLTPEHVFQP